MLCSVEFSLLLLKEALGSWEVVAVAVEAEHLPLIVPLVVVLHPRAITLSYFGVQSSLRIPNGKFEPFPKWVGIIDRIFVSSEIRLQK